MIILNKVNRLKNNDKDSMQYIITAHLFNKSFIHLLIAQNTLLSNKVSLVQYFVIDYYTETVFQDIISDTNIAKVSIAGKSH